MLTEEQRARVCVVLVRARNPNNIGAVARAMHGFGFADLRLVNDYSVGLETARSAVDASAILAQARQFASVPEAVAAYRSFQRNFRDADWNAAMTALTTAVERDPTMAAAHLRLAFMRSLESVDEGLVRTTFMQALRNNPQMRAAFIDRVAAPIANKMFQCGMLP